MIEKKIALRFLKQQYIIYCVVFLVSYIIIKKKEKKRDREREKEKIKGKCYDVKILMKQCDIVLKRFYNIFFSRGRFFVNEFIQSKLHNCQF